MATRMVVEVGRTAVRVALAEGRGTRWHIQALQSLPIGGPADVASTLRAFLGRAKVSPANVIGVIPRELVIARVVKFPTADRSELVQMVQLYAKSQLPYPKEQAVTDFFLLTQAEGFSTVAVVACQREVIDRQLTPLREAGLPASFITVSSWGVLGWFRHAGRLASVATPSLIVNIDETRTDLVLVTDGRLVSSRSVGQGLHELQGAGQTPELLVAEVERSLSAIRQELPELEVRSLVLTGLGPLTQWQEEIARRLGLTVTVMDARQPLRLRKDAAPSMPAPSFSPVVVGGLALSELSGLLNLSPPEMHAEVHHRRQVRELVAVSALLIVALGLGAALLSVQVSRQRQVVGQLDQALGDIAPAAKQLQEKNRSVQLVTGILRDRRQLAVTLSGVFRETPASVTLEGLTFERDRRELALKGRAESTQAVLAYMKALERLDEVRGVNLRYSAQRSGSAGDHTSFEIVLSQARPEASPR